MFLNIKSEFLNLSVFASQSGIIIFIATPSHRRIMYFEHFEAKATPAIELFTYPWVAYHRALVAIVTSQLSLTLDFVEATCVCALILRHRKNKQRNKTFWVHSIISSRLLDGQFYKLFDKLREHPNKFFNYFRMSIESFGQLLVALGPRRTYQNTSLRQTAL